MEPLPKRHIYNDKLYICTTNNKNIINDKISAIPATSAKIRHIFRINGNKIGKIIIVKRYSLRKKIKLISEQIIGNKITYLK